MIYRPQFLYPSAPGEEEFAYYFSERNMPALAMVNTLQPGQSIDPIVLHLQPDAPFRVRAVQIMVPVSPFSLILKDSDGKALCDFGLPEFLTYQPSNTPNWFLPVNNVIGYSHVVLEPEIPCPADGLLQLTVLNATAAPLVVAFLSVVLRGVKRFKGAS